jgi:isoquinoline 1-oxidoreductase beta subunit
VEGSVPDKIDDAKAKVIAGAVRIIRLPYGVGVLAETPWAAFEARRALAVTWSRTGTAWGFDSEKGMEQFAADAKNPARGATEWSKIGDPRGEMPKASSTVEAEYRCDYAKPEHCHRGACQASRHYARQGEAARHVDGRRLWTARQP